MYRLFKLDCFLSFFSSLFLLICLAALADSSLAFQLCGAAPVWGQAIKCANWKRVSEAQNTNGFTYVWIQIQMGLHMLCMNTNTNTFTYKARSDGESVSTVSWQTKYFLLSFCQLYSGTNLSLRFLRLDCLVLIPSPPLPRLITTTQSPAAHSEETLSHPGLPHTDVIFPQPRPQTYRLQGFEVVLFQGFYVVLFQGF